MTRLSVGATRCRRPRDGRVQGIAEYAVAPEALLGKKPASVSFGTGNHAAGVTAMQAFRLAHMDVRGKRILIISVWRRRHICGAACQALWRR
ncbi:MAG: hypothetical protein R2912_10910 [Eubacteriales bacterium]